MKCLRCGAEMQSAGVEKLQLGEASLFWGLWKNVMAGAIEVAIYVCPVCRKLEFFAPYDTEEKEVLPQAKCPQCGKEHDFDCPRCPHCKHKYNDPSE